MVELGACNNLPQPPPYTSLSGSCSSMLRTVLAPVVMSTNTSNLSHATISHNRSCRRLLHAQSKACNNPSAYLFFLGVAEDCCMLPTLGSSRDVYTYIKSKACNNLLQPPPHISLFGSRRRLLYAPKYFCSSRDVYTYIKPKAC